MLDERDIQYVQGRGASRTGLKTPNHKCSVFLVVSLPRHSALTSMREGGGDGIAVMEKMIHGYGKNNACRIKHRSVNTWIE